jgi:hypothetical protein
VGIGQEKDANDVGHDPQTGEYRVVRPALTSLTTNAPRSSTRHRLHDSVRAPLAMLRAFRNLS